MLFCFSLYFRYNADVSSPVTVALASFVDYDTALSSQAVNIRIDDYYVTYNAARNMNADTREYRNMVVVVQKVPDEQISGYYDSNLVAALDTATSTFTVQNYNGAGSNLVIQVCDMVSGSPDYVTVAIGLNADC